MRTKREQAVGNVIQGHWRTPAPTGADESESQQLTEVIAAHPNGRCILHRNARPDRSTPGHLALGARIRRDSRSPNRFIVFRGRPRKRHVDGLTDSPLAIQYRV